MTTNQNTRRQFIRSALAMAVASCVGRALGRNPRGGAAAGVAIPFDYFISPNGDDNNNGLTPATAWSITALNSKQATYTGKRIGIVGDISGTQTSITQGSVGGVVTTLLALANAQSTGQGNALVIDGGTSSASTYVASCDSSGVYKARWAVLDFGNPSVETFMIAQTNYFPAHTTTHWGYLTVDGLTIQNFNYCAIGVSNVAVNNIAGLIIKNCDIHHGRTATSADNPGAIALAGTTGAVITNNKISDLQCQGGGASPTWGFSALRTYGSTAGSGGSLQLVFTHNMCFNCHSILTKDGQSDFADCSYNYLDNGNFGSAGNSDGDLAVGSIVGHSPGSGITSKIHHNILLGAMQVATQAGGNTIYGTVQMYNNTLYGTQATFLTAYCKNANSAAAAIQFYNNISYAAVSYDHTAVGGGLWVQTPYTIANATFDKNVYGSNSNAQAFSRTAEDQGWSLATWQSNTSCDANSVSSANPFTGTPAAQTPSSFAVNSSAIIGGVTCGALDGSGTVGPDW